MFCCKNLTLQTYQEETPKQDFYSTLLEIRHQSALAMWSHTRIIPHSGSPFFSDFIYVKAKGKKKKNPVVDCSGEKSGFSLIIHNAILQQLYHVLAQFLTAFKMETRIL